MSKLGEDNYKRPKKTYTDKLTDDDIKAKLEDYVEVDDISMVPLNSHVRYFTEKINEKKKKEKVFRLGGFLVNKSNYEKYIILSNVPETGFINPIKKTWSVNTKTSIFYKKQTLDEIKEEYELEIEDLKDQIKFLKKEIKKLKVKKG
tara:strand:- start:783 stop:1223 length:441 start_codon:yes stop_codon:yes gene_type:complete